MEFIKEDEKTIAILKDGDVLEVQTLQGNPLHISIKCIDGTFLVDEITVKRIKEIKMEQEQLEILRKRNQKRNKDFNSK